MRWIDFVPARAENLPRQCLISKTLTNRASKFQSRRARVSFGRAGFEIPTDKLPCDGPAPPSIEVNAGARGMLDLLRRMNVFTLARRGLGFDDVVMVR
ncbi:MAG: hypothetical protein KGK01_02500 [Bradyrhizobium sp.]|uniref:hypothetical protein n=1 Tax=Bradyrhizobium sp. TaxID=376 RepID=UPI001C28603C|nr:hypothetical protein [Bradyrhizobium sp.]MBU6463214.1 hypothetical protein [Pseudomonadota bacterium]MDE2068084.1 hypothetical protein [Bradyrhizobium sp.]MDE2241334.1 hypothetical protein [Bradyrhizobium sp.]MDE2469778.1 hypothetical protein [Bradyrhizobium sp.]